MIKFGKFAKGWIARVLPELMPEGSLRRCDDLNFSIGGGLRCVREFQELTVPTGVSSTTDMVHSFFQVMSGLSTLTYMIRSGNLYRDLNNGGFAALETIEVSTFDYSTDFTEVDTGSVLTVDTTGVTAAALQSDYEQSSKLYRTVTAMSDFEFDFDFRCTGVTGDYSGTTSAAGAMLFGAYDNISPRPGWQGNAGLSVLHISGVTVGGQHRVWVVQNPGALIIPNQKTAWTGVTRNTDYYTTVKYDTTVGDHGRFSCDIYSDSARTTLLKAVDLDLVEWGSGPNLKYVFGICSCDAIDVAYWDKVNAMATGTACWDGRVRNLIQRLGLFGDPTRAVYSVMTPSIATRKHVYIATDAGLLRDTGQTKFASGTSWVDVGVPDGGTLTTGVSATDTGSLTAGDYKMAYTCYDSLTGAEGYPSDTETVTVTADDKVRFKWITTSAAIGHADKVKLYRSIVDGGTLYLVGDVTASTGTSLSGIGDSVLGAPIGDVGKPPKNASLCAAWKGRLWLSGVSYFDGADANGRIFYSRNLNPETVPPDYYLAVPETEAEVKALAVVNGILHIVTESTIFQVEGTSAQSFDLSDALSPVGTCSARSVAVGEDGLFFLGYDGVYKFRYKTEKISSQIDWVFDHSGDTWTSRVAKTDLESAKGTYYDNKYYITIGTKTYVYDDDLQSWRRRTTPFTCLWGDRIDGNLYGGVSIPPYYCVARLIKTNLSGISGLYAPDFITKSEPMSPIVEDQTEPRMGTIERFRLHAKGFWTFYFYIDETLAHTTTGTTYEPTTRNTVYNLPQSLKGDTIYVRGVASGNSATPKGCRFYSMEVW